MELAVMENRKIELKKNKKKGFTLIEMVVVIAIIAIIAAIAIPQALRAVNKAKVTADIAAAKTIATAMSRDIAEGATLSDTKDWTVITGTTTPELAKNLEGGALPASKKNSSYKFYYKYTAAENKLQIGAGPESPTSANPVRELYPLPDKDY